MRTLEPSGMIQLEVTSRCNLACRACPHGTPGIDIEERDMPLEVFRRAVDSTARPGRRYHLQGWGEPLLLPDLPERVLSISRRGMVASVTTNGTLLTRDLAERLVEAGLEILTFSISGGDPAVHRRNRPGSDLERILESIRTVARVKRHRRKERPSIAASFEMSRSGIGTLRDAVRRLKKAGIERMIAIHPILALTADQQRELLVGMDDSPEWEEPLRGLRRGVAASMFRSLPLDNEPWVAGKGTVCREDPSESLFIGAAGDLSPCTFLGLPVQGTPAHRHRLTFGNILESTLSGIWNSPEYVAFREAWSSGTAPEACRHCLRSHGY